MNDMAEADLNETDNLADSGTHYLTTSSGPTISDLISRVVCDRFREYLVAVIFVSVDC